MVCREITRVEAHHALVQLKRTWAPASLDTQAKLMGELFRTRQGSDSVSAYSARFNRIRASISAAGLVLPEGVFAFFLLCGARETLSSVIRVGDDTSAASNPNEDFAPEHEDTYGIAVLSTTTSPYTLPSTFTVVSVFTKLRAAENREAEAKLREAEDAVQEAAANTMRTRSAPQTGRSAQGAPQTPNDASSRSKERTWCAWHNRLTFHTTDTCKDKLQGQPKTGGASQAVTTESNVQSTGVSSCFARSSADNDTAYCCLSNKATCQIAASAPRHAVIIDSGATETMTPVEKAFVLGTYQPFPTPRRVILGDGSAIPALGMGTIVFNARVNGCPSELRLDDVWHVPALGMTLLSVNRLHSRGMHVNFPPAVGVIVREGKEIAHATFTGSGWSVEGTLAVHDAPAAHANIALPEALWHARFCHPNRKDLRRAPSMVNGMSLAPSPSDETDFCRACALGKAKRQPFPSSETVSSHPLALLAVDLVGAPGDITGRGGAKYAMIVHDAYSTNEWSFTFAKKSAAALLVRDLIVRLETQTGRRLLVFRTDGGGEFFPGWFERWCKTKGIQHQSTFADSSQSNGLAERAIGVNGTRTAATLAAADIAARGLPPSFWTDAFHTAVYVRSLTPNSSHPTAVPVERFTGERPSVAHLRVFGCEAYVHLPKKKRQGHRYGPRAIETIFIGYTLTDGKKGYRLWDPKEKRILLSRDVTFREDAIVSALRQSIYLHSSPPTQSPAPIIILPSDTDTSSSPTLPPHSPTPPPTPSPAPSSAPSPNLPPLPGTPFVTPPDSPLTELTPSPPPVPAPPPRFFVDVPAFPLPRTAPPSSHDLNQWSRANGRLRRIDDNRAALSAACLSVAASSPLVPMPSADPAVRVCDDSLSAAGNRPLRIDGASSSLPSPSPARTLLYARVMIRSPPPVYRPLRYGQVRVHLLTPPFSRPLNAQTLLQTVMTRSPLLVRCRQCRKRARFLQHAFPLTMMRKSSQLSSAQRTTRSWPKSSSTTLTSSPASIPPLAASTIPTNRSPLRPL